VDNPFNAIKLHLHQFCDKFDPRVKENQAMNRDELIDRIRATGARVTAPRVAVLSALLSSDKALSHQEVEEALTGTPVDRVTVYRVLDWLADEGLAHKIADDKRVYRFSASSETGEPHAHFKCRNCNGVFCLERVSNFKVRLPRGFKSEEIDLTVKGTCASCAA
jgi:Fur family ferric uptake transcriptional regulator